MELKRMLSHVKKQESNYGTVFTTKQSDHRRTCHRQGQPHLGNNTTNLMVAEDSVDPTAGVAAVVAEATVFMDNGLLLFIVHQGFILEDIFMGTQCVIEVR
ncbi:unnamed protein product [Cuscuta europaea]|uniref:Uncharacterized protein n=1 Tax=Cuscuta europaea TaxID=41803 RepID=A0A9P0Z3B3_CUSEU|nr:unnamed protein product [Cuscuta europaea]